MKNVGWAKRRHELESGTVHPGACPPFPRLAWWANAVEYRGKTKATGGICPPYMKRRAALITSAREATRKERHLYENV